MCSTQEPGACWLLMDHTATVANPGGWTAGPAWQQTWGRSGQRSSTHLHRGLQGLFFLLFHALLQARQVLGSGAVSRRQALSNAHSRRSSHTSPCPDPHLYHQSLQGSLLPGCIAHGRCGILCQHDEFHTLHSDQASAFPDALPGLEPITQISNIFQCLL